MSKLVLLLALVSLVATPLVGQQDVQGPAIQLSAVDCEVMGPDTYAIDTGGASALVVSELPAHGVACLYVALFQDGMLFPPMLVGAKVNLDGVEELSFPVKLPPSLKGFRFLAGVVHESKEFPQLVTNLVDVFVK